MNNLTINKILTLTLICTLQAQATQADNRKITVAVIDTGADVNHTALKANIWTNVGESGVDALGRNKSTNGLDDDENGFIDDFHGWNFSSNKGDVSDSHGHGTHIAGIIGGHCTSCDGSHQGVAPDVNLMILKYYDPFAPGENNLQASIRAIDYAIKMKADIINYSGGGTQRSLAEEAAIRRVQKAGILFVAAAGNEKSNSDILKYYPADYQLSNIISVTATDNSNNILPSSNFGIHSVDIAAPGKSVNSTIPGGGYGRMTGTSQATAFVSGTAALLMSKNPYLSAEQVIQYLIKTGTPEKKLIGKTKHQVLLDTYKAISMQDQNTNAFGKVAANTQKMDPKYFLSE